MPIFGAEYYCRSFKVSLINFVGKLNFKIQSENKILTMLSKSVAL